jgi:hypothetical protein
LAHQKLQVLIPQRKTMHVYDASFNRRLGHHCQVLKPSLAMHFIRFSETEQGNAKSDENDAEGLYPRQMFLQNQSSQNSGEGRIGGSHHRGGGGSNPANP